MPIGELFNALFFAPIVNILVFLLKILEVLRIPGALGIAIILLTLIIRLASWPLTHSQIKSAQKMSQLKPKLDELKRKHKDNKQALQLAQMQLYKEHGVNPAGGCLPALIQIPIFIALYQVIIYFLPSADKTATLEKINSLLYFDFLNLSVAPDPNFFGLNLIIKPSDFSTQGMLLLLVPIITAALTFVQSKMSMPNPPKHYPSDTPKEVKEKESMEETMTQVQSQMVYFMPIMVGYFAFSFPIGLAFYWNTYTILGIIQQYMVSGWGGLSDWLAKFKK